MTEFSRKTQLLAWLAYLIALLISWAWLPAMVGDNGKQVAKVAYVAIMLVTALPLPWVTCGGLLKWLRQHPSLLNLPQKDYWLAPERTDATWARLDGFLLRLGWMIWCLLALIHCREVVERPGDPEDQTVLPVLSATTFEIMVFVFVIVMLADVLRSTLAWRVPRAQLEAFRSQQIRALAELAGQRSARRPPRLGQASRGPDRGESR